MDFNSPELHITTQKQKQYKCKKLNDNETARISHNSALLLATAKAYFFSGNFQTEFPSSLATLYSPTFFPNRLFLEYTFLILGFCAE